LILLAKRLCHSQGLLGINLVDDAIDCTWEHQSDLATCWLQAHTGTKHTDILDHLQVVVVLALCFEVLTTFVESAINQAINRRDSTRCRCAGASSAAATAAYVSCIRLRVLISVLRSVSSSPRAVKSPLHGRSSNRAIEQSSNRRSQHRLNGQEQQSRHTPSNDGPATRARSCHVCCKYAIEACLTAVCRYRRGGAAHRSMACERERERASVGA